MPKQYLQLFALLYVCGFGHCIDCGQKQVIQPGDNVTLQCGCEKGLRDGRDIIWLRICSTVIQPWVISVKKSIIDAVPRFHSKMNAKDQGYNLIIENVTKSDLGLYYCAEVEEKDVDGKFLEVYHICNGSTKLSFEVSSQASSVTQEYDCSQCWLLMQCACPVCSLVSALLSALCVFYCCHKKVQIKVDSSQRRLNSWRQDSGEEVTTTEVTYASLNIPKKPNKRSKMNTSVNPDLCIYSEVNKRRDLFD